YKRRLFLMFEMHFNYINGEWVSSRTGKTYNSINPANKEEILGRFQYSDENDVELAIESCENAFDRWAETPAPKRGNVLFNLIELLEQQKEILAEIITKEVGK